MPAASGSTHSAIPPATSGLDTIVALATAPGAAAVGVLRLSGPAAIAIAEGLLRGRGGTPLAPPLAERASHRASHAWLVDPGTGARVDEVLALVMRAPRSFTGEDVVELQGHGSPLLLQRALRLCLEAGARLAAPGEFTRRAFLLGRLDLTQAEAVADLVGARSERALERAVAQLEGALGRAVAEIREGVVGLLARIEAAIDYPDEIPDLEGGEAAGALTTLRGRLATLLGTARQGRALREGAAVALVGRPNVGKSSLLNALLGRDRAIVTELPGTTRDLLEEPLVLRGVPFRLLDTAGIREAQDRVEALGVARTRAALAAADLVVLVHDLGEGWTPEDEAIAEEVRATASGDRPVIVVGNKRDLLPPESVEALAEASAGREGGPGLDAPAAWGSPPWVLPPWISLPWVLSPWVFRAVAATTGEGLRDLEAALVEAALGVPPEAASMLAINARHEAALAAADLALAAAEGAVAEGLPPDCWTIDLREAVAALGVVTGRDLSEEVIDTLFARFCVGK